MPLTFENSILIFVVFFIGSCLGSFFKLTVDRYGTNDSFVFKPSYCFNCKNNLSWWQNIPVISYLILQGKCFFCKEKIDTSNFYTEITTGIILSTIFISGLIKNQTNVDIGLTILFASFLLILSVFDLKHRIIPHIITYSAIIMFLMVNFFIRKDFLHPLMNLGIAYVFMDLLYFFSTVLKKDSLETNSISIPLLIWSTMFFYTHNALLSIIPSVIYLFLSGFRISVKSHRTLWLVFSVVLLIQIYKTVFLNFNLPALGALFTGYGTIYVICEIMLYFLGLFIQKNDSVEESEPQNISIGGGDITVFALISVFLGFKVAFIALFIASLFGIISHFIFRVLKKFSVSQIPFVPYLSAACFIIIITSHGN